MQKPNFRHIAAHHACDDPVARKAEKALKASANVLMQSLLQLVLEE